MKKNIDIKPTIINYGSESIDIFKKCCSYLIENNFYNNDKETNINLLEKSLINYTIINLVEWNIDIENIGIDNFDNLKLLLDKTNNIIPTLQEQKDYFNQYTYCILYIYSQIIKQQNDEIKWNTSELVENDIILEYENNILKSITTNDKYIPHELPILLLNKLKAKHKTNKNPILIK